MVMTNITPALARAVDREEGGFIEAKLINGNIAMRELWEEIIIHHISRVDEESGLRAYYKDFTHNGVEMVCVRLTWKPTRTVEGNTSEDCAAYAGTISEIIASIHCLRGLCDLYNNMYSSRIDTICSTEGWFTEVTTKVLEDKNNSDLVVLNKEILYHNLTAFFKDQGYKVYYKRFRDNGLEMVCIMLKRDNPGNCCWKDPIVYSGTPSEIIALMHCIYGSCNSKNVSEQTTQR
ncbi:hypothetical protein DFH11DRAFT_1599044 [Phellopilus nigrolimitatus]|nr:hypothetical protein DFH11DRAFT_1599044 [Phellopilus nigrolimitatus]